MYTKQVSIFLENKKGRLADVTKVLSDEGVNIRALSLAETTDYGVLRLIVSDLERCMSALRAHGLAAQATDVIAVEVPDRPGGLHGVVQTLDREGLNIEYMYAFVEKKTDNAIVVFRIDQPQRAAAILEKNKISVLSSDVISKL